MADTKRFHMHLVSDATGETIQSVVRACIAQFEQVKAEEHFWNMVRTDRQLDWVLDGIRQDPGVVVFTLVDEHLRRRLTDFCREVGVPCISVLDPVIATLGNYLGLRSQSRPGRQYTLDAAYFSRMEAVDFTLTHDDGQSTWDLHLADVVIVGVSRTSKTPTCLYLANRGYSAANIPYVPNCPLPPEVMKLTRPLIVGVTKDPDQLVQVRRNRMRMLNQSVGTDYVNPEAVRAEVLEARRFYNARGWPVIDVSRRAIEETAAEILGLLAQRRRARNIT
ncbi:MAG: kinase/pyrophosphorylase [Rhodospirillaceae bacterium]|nr:kinase/pyrophosphorylase [Rhodospirillaceae bacterium]MCA8934059.1 kinase/pyrophosphorylase [Rhodospirillaceae bacterium]